MPADPTPPELLERQEGGVLHLRLNRPHKRNALTPTLVWALTDALRRADADPTVRCVLLSGAGEHFCAGADLSALRGGAPADGPVGRFPDLLAAAGALRTPLVGVVQGSALAGAIGLVCACHVVVAGAGARFGLPEVDRGLWPMMVMDGLLRTVSRRDALRLMLGGDVVDAVEAARMGLVSEVVADDALASAGLAWAERLAAKPPWAVAAGLDALDALPGWPAEERLDRLESALGALAADPQTRALIAGFLAKRGAPSPTAG